MSYFLPAIRSRISTPRPALWCLHSESGSKQFRQQWHSGRGARGKFIPEVSDGTLPVFLKTMRCRFARSGSLNDEQSAVFDVSNCSLRATVEHHSEGFPTLSQEDMEEDCDAQALFLKSYTNSNQYPLNLVQISPFEHSLKQYYERLDQLELDIFHNRHRSLYFWDLPSEKAEKFCLSAKVETLADMQKHLNISQLDPSCRFMFFQTASSGSRLLCSRDQLSHLCTYYQVMPSFLDLVIAFKRREAPLETALFRKENSIQVSENTTSLLGLGRSGSRIQHCFSLLSTEQIQCSAEQILPLSLLQTAVYHSFDAITGRAQWIILGNEVIRQNVVNATKGSKALQPLAYKTVEQAFIAALTMHLVLIDWSSQNFAQYIEYVGSVLRQLCAKLERVTESATETATPAPSRSGTLSHRHTRNSTTIAARTTTESRPASVQSFSSTVRPASDSVLQGIELQDGLMRSRPDVSRDINIPTGNNADPNQAFSLDNFQTLTCLEDSLDDAIMVIEQNRKVLGELKEHLKQTAEAMTSTPQIPINTAPADILAFSHRIDRIDGDLKRYQDQLSNVFRIAIKQKIMLEEILSRHQQTTGHSTKATLDVAQLIGELASDMHETARRSYMESTSINVTLLVTLIFQPASFVAAVFSSGVIHWDDDGTLGTEFVVRRHGLKIFALLSFPLIFITLILWILLVAAVRARWRKTLE